MSVALLAACCVAHINTLYFTERTWRRTEAGTLEIDVKLSDPEDNEISLDMLVAMHTSKMHFVVASADASLVVHTHIEWGRVERDVFTFVINEPLPGGWYFLSFDFSLARNINLLSSALISIFDRHLDGILLGPELDEFNEFLSPYLGGNISTPRGLLNGKIQHYATEWLVKRILAANTTLEDTLWGVYSGLLTHGAISARVYLSDRSEFFVEGGVAGDVAQSLIEPVTHAGKTTHKGIAILGEGCDTTDIKACTFHRKNASARPKYRAVLRMEEVAHCEYPGERYWLYDDDLHIPDWKQLKKFTSATIATLKVYHAEDVDEVAPLQMTPLLGAYAHVYVLPRGETEYPQFEHIHAQAELAQHSADCWDLLPTTTMVIPSEDAFSAVSFALNGSRIFREATVIVQINVAGEYLTAVYDVKPDAEALDATYSPTYSPSVFLEGPCSCEGGWVFIGSDASNATHTLCNCVKLSDGSGAYDSGVCEAEGAMLAVFPSNPEDTEDPTHFVQRALAGDYITGVYGSTDAEATHGRVRTYLGGRLNASGTHYQYDITDYPVPAVENVDVRDIYLYSGPGKACLTMGGVEAGLYGTDDCTATHRHLCMRREWTAVPLASIPEEVKTDGKVKTGVIALFVVLSCMAFAAAAVLSTRKTGVTQKQATPLPSEADDEEMGVQQVIYADAEKVGSDVIASERLTGKEIDGLDEVVNQPCEMSEAGSDSEPHEVYVI